MPEIAVCGAIDNDGPLKRPWIWACGLAPDHWESRHYADLPGLGSYTWGWLPQQERKLEDRT